MIPWKKARGCDSGACVEAEVVGDSVKLRETANPDREIVTTVAAVNAFVAGWINGEWKTTGRHHA